jgi:hypothetical protein
MLTDSYPDLQTPGTTWIAKAKDHVESNESNIDVWAIGIYDPENEWDARIFTNKSGDLSNTPYTQAILADGYVLTGGGAGVDRNPSWAGNILTASYPEPAQQVRWTAESRAPDDNDPTRISAFAIGLRHRTGAVHLRTKIFEQKSSRRDNQPTTEVAVDTGYTLVGGGACVVKTDLNRNYLTASYPDFQKGKWIANSKDHHSDPTTIKAYAIGLEILR